MTAAQIFAIIIFVGMFVMVVLDKIERHYVTLGSGALMLIVVFGVCMRSGSAVWNTLALKGFATESFWYQVTESESKGINWATIVFIAGMMVMVEGMAKAGFFRWLCMRIAYLVKMQNSSDLHYIYGNVSSSFNVYRQHYGDHVPCCGYYRACTAS